MEGKKGKYVSHLVGIIPVQNGPTNDGYPWPNALTPLYKSYTALHRSVMECAVVGCTSIWIIAEKKHIPLLKTIVGVSVEDPVLLQLPLKFKRDYRMLIPIWYASLPVREVSVTDCYGRTILAGAEYAMKLSGRLSDHLLPDKFFVSFPHKVASAWRLRKSRKDVKDNKKNFHILTDGKTIKDDVCSSFTFFASELDPLLDDFKSMDFRQFEYTGIPGEVRDLKLLKRLPVEDRYTGKRLTLDKVFKTLILDDAILHDSGKIYDISSWEGYAEYIKESNWYRMPKKVKYFRFNKIKNLEERLINTGEYDDYDRFTGVEDANLGIKENL